jgi:hypothetical protein
MAPMSHVFRGEWYLVLSCQVLSETERTEFLTKKKREEMTLQIPP